MSGEGSKRVLQKQWDAGAVISSESCSNVQRAVAAIPPKELYSFPSSFTSSEDKACPLGHWRSIRGDFTPKGYLETSGSVFVSQLKGVLRASGLGGC